MSATYLSHAENVLYNMDLCFLPLRPRDSVNSDTCYCTLKTKNNIKLKKTFLPNSNSQYKLLLIISPGINMLATVLLLW